MLVYLGTWTLSSPPDAEVVSIHCQNATNNFFTVPMRKTNSKGFYSIIHVCSKITMAKPGYAGDTMVVVRVGFVPFSIYQANW